MRKGVSDLYRNFQVGMGANQRYLQALAAAPLKGEGVAALDALCRPRTRRGRTVARFSPLNPADLALFKAALAGQHTMNGFRNADLTARLYRRPARRPRRSPPTMRTSLPAHHQTARPRPRRQSPRARLYRVTPYGQRVMAAALAIHNDQYPTHYLARAE